MPSASTAKNGRFGGLDGLRAIAVALVLIYHFFPKALPGGFLGVDVFLVISGFLITSLLLREHDATGRIDLVGFWRRRARRLLPAVALVVLVSTTLALAVSRDLLVGIAAQIVGAVFFVSNWVFVAGGTDYFESEAPELFRNFWSLALEEQFYIVLPVLAMALFKLRKPGARAIPLLILGLVSASLMAKFSASGVDATRIYFGSDSHSFGLLFGAATAVLVQRFDRQPLRLGGQLVTTIAASLGLAVIGFLAATLVEGSNESFLGGFHLATIASIIVVWAITRNSAWVGRILDVQPLRWIGERSYGIYLWHWPLLLIVGEAFPRSGPGATSYSWIAPIIALPLTFGIAALSYRFVEQPIRRLGLRGAFKLWLTPRSHTKRQRLVSVSLVTLLAIAFPLSTVAVVLAPSQTTSADAVLRGQEILEADQSGAHPSAAADSEESDGGGSSSDGQAGVEDIIPAPLRVEGADITAVGDSVMLASYPELSGQFPGIEVDAAVSRGMWAGVDIVSTMQAEGALRQVVVVGLATNGPVDDESLQQIRDIIWPRPLVLVNAHAERDWIGPANSTLESFAQANRGVTIARWTESITGFPEYLAGDGIHPGTSGGELYAHSIQEALDELSAPGEAVGWGVSRR